MLVYGAKKESQLAQAGGCAALLRAGSRLDREAAAQQEWLRCPPAPLLVKIEQRMPLVGTDLHIYAGLCAGADKQEGRR